MTAYGTRTPLQLLSNPYAMSDLRRSTRRTSARLADKEDALVANGNGHGAEKANAIQKNGADAGQGQSTTNGTGDGVAGKRGKRKQGMSVCFVAAEHGIDVMETLDCSRCCQRLSATDWW